MNERLRLWRFPCATGLVAIAFVVVLRLAVAGRIASSSASVLAPLTLLALVACAFRARVELGLAQNGEGRPLVRRHGFWVVAVGTLVGLPALGTSGLVDPWETHYAEVAREMLERRDFISPWWANEGWFMSKPVLTFWLEAIAMAVFGVRTGPDQILASSRVGAIAHPEWAIRFPSFALALVGAYLLYHGVAKAYGRRAGAIGAFVLWTMPGFLLLSHQGMTDMPLVACVAASLGLVLRALSTDDDVVASGSARYGVALLVATVTLSQVGLLLLQYVHLDGGTVHFAPPRLVAGSPHACSLPGQPACTTSMFAHPKITPLVQATLWMPLALLLVVRAATEKREARQYALAAWTFAALAAMAKGPAGLVVPTAAVIVHVLTNRSPRDILRLELGIGLLLAVTMIGPWYLAVYARHGRMFIDELVLRHMLGRTLDHLHDTNEGEDVGIVYFVRQLAFATFPWSGFAALAAFGTTSQKDRGGPRTDTNTRAVLFGAAMISFALVSSMRTKFHHYALVGLPPMAMLTGIWIDDLLESGRWRSRGAHVRRVATATALIACVVATVGREIVVDSNGMRGPASFILLFTYRYDRKWTSTSTFVLTFAVLTFGFVALALASGWPRFRAKALAGFGLLGLALAIALLHLYLPRCAVDGGQRDVIASYYAARTADDRGPLVAYQLNWKGENFYTGNDVAIFITSGAAMKAYLERRRELGERTTFFVTERGRVSALQRELGAVSSFAELTGPDVSAEFTLVRAVL